MIVLISSCHFFYYKTCLLPRIKLLQDIYCYTIISFMISLFKSSIYSYLLKSRKIASSLCLIDILKRLEKVPCQEQLSSIIKPHCGQLGAMHSFGPQIFSLWKKPLCYEEIMLLALPLAFILHSISADSIFISLQLFI